MPDLTVRPIPCSTALLLLMAMTTAPAIAQSNVAADPIAPLEDTLQHTGNETTEPPTDDIDEDSAEQPVEVATPSALHQCKADKSQLVGTLVQLQQESRGLLAACETTASTSILSLEEQLTVCTENERLNRRTNIGLNDALEACRSAPPPIGTASSKALEQAETQIEALRHRLAALDDYAGNVQTELDTAEATVAQLQARLEELGANLVPEFSYFGADPFEGFVRASDIVSLVGSDGTITTDQCAGAMDWLIAQSGDDRYLRPVLWVVQGGELALCKKGVDSAVSIENPSPTDEAHLVLFR